MNFTSMPATGLMRGQWAPYRAPLLAGGPLVGQAQTATFPTGGTGITVVQPKPVPFIDGPFFSLLMDAAVATAGGLGWRAYSREADNKEYSDEKRQKNRRWSYVFMGITGLGALKAVLDASRLMR
jgi:hypothetical protein